MPKDENTPDLFEADGVTPKKADAKPAITEGEIEARERAARAEGKASGMEAALKAAPKTEKKGETVKEVTRAELRVKVNAGEITEDQMDEILDLQREARIKRDVEAQVSSRVSAATTEQKITGDIARYVEAFPDINADGSALRGKIEREFEDLVRNGSPNALSTELAAIKIVCGQLNVGKGRKADPETFEETGGAGENHGKGGEGDWAKGLSAAQKKHYEKLINSGVYSGTKDPKLVKELTFARKTH